MTIRRHKINSQCAIRSKVTVDTAVTKRVHREIIVYIRDEVRERGMQHDEEIYFTISCNGNIVSVAGRDKVKYFRLDNDEKQIALDVVVKYNSNHGKYMFIPIEEY